MPPSNSVIRLRDPRRCVHRPIPCCRYRWKSRSRPIYRRFSRSCFSSAADTGWRCHRKLAAKCDRSPIRILNYDRRTSSAESMLRIHPSAIVSNRCHRHFLLFPHCLDSLVGITHSHLPYKHSNFFNLDRQCPVLHELCQESSSAISSDLNWS